LESYKKNTWSTFIQSIRCYLPSFVRTEQGGGEIFEVVGWGGVG
jgi:hypothetical protein